MIRRLFDSLYEIEYNELDKCRTSKIIDSLEFYRKITPLSGYIIDYVHQCFVYVSDESPFLCGYSSLEIKKMGFDYFEKVIPPEDLKMLIEINNRYLEFLHEQFPSQRPNCYLSCDFRMNHKDGSTLLVNQKQNILYCNENGDVILSFCHISFSKNEKRGNVYMGIDGHPVKFFYSLQSKKIQQTQIPQLTDREKEILDLMANGLQESGIAALLCIDIYTVKFHKRNIYDKFEVKNGMQAISYAFSNRIF